MSRKWLKLAGNGYTYLPQPAMGVARHLRVAAVRKRGSQLKFN